MDENSTPQVSPQMAGLLKHKVAYEASIAEKKNRHDSKSRDVLSSLMREQVALGEINAEIEALTKREAAAKK